MSNRSLILVPAAALALNVAASVEGHAAAVDYFLKIDGIIGPEIAQHKGELRLESFSWGAEATVSQGSGGGGGAGKLTHTVMNFTLPVSGNTPDLYKRVADGTHIKSATLYVYSSAGVEQGIKGEKATLIEQVDFQNVELTSFNDSAANGDLPRDQVTLNFSKATVQKLGAPPVVLPPESNGDQVSTPTR